MNSHSVVQFNALVTIHTASNSVNNTKVEITITFDGYNNSGRLFFTKDDLDPLLFPTTFNAKWDKMQHVDQVYLAISGFHKRNPTIGNYTAKVVPLERLRD